MQLQNKLFIDGQWVSGSGGKLEVLNPATNERLAVVDTASRDDIGKAIASAHKAFTKVWGVMNPFERSSCLHKVGDAIERNAEFLAGVETDDVGKPIFESLNIDVAGAAQTFHYFADVSTQLTGDVIPSPFNEVLDFTLREPLGVVGAITPWNFPFLIGARKVASALAAGNTMVIKPASATPLSTLLFGELFQEAGVPPGVLNIVPASGRDIGAVFGETKELHEISFTGSTAVGRILMAGCSKEPKGCTLELGGKSPALVLSDCDMKETVDGLLFGVYLNQGECCCAATRIIAHEDVYDELLERFVAGSKAIKVGMPREEDVRMGPLVDAGHFGEVMGYVNAGVSEGARLVCGGKAVDCGAGASGNFLLPTVFENVKSDMRIWREEIFGPVVVFAKAGSVDEMVAMANDTDYGLAASIWTTNLKRAHILSRQLDAGTVWCNLHNFVFPCAPYGGFKASGIGLELGIDGLKALTRTKNVMINMFEDGFKWY